LDVHEARYDDLDANLEARTAHDADAVRFSYLSLLYKQLQRN